ncbi:MAG: tRNA pseudouridine(55) synthase TruB, partial [Candidatus Electryoneaceae bacterium]|nr:tRNA pseudouridine(55) synthase TruB [Candidatus Electryoneaceae bacterium]
EHSCPADDPVQQFQGKDEHSCPADDPVQQFQGKDEHSCPASWEGTIIAVNKPPGPSSFNIVHQIRLATKVKKVGHAGTLDPFAQGVLIIGIGRAATRRLGDFMRQEKEYIASVTLGIVTDTDDPTGKILEQNPFDPFSEEQIQSVISRFIGEIDQLPPMYSAVKVKGMRLYEAARRGIEIERKLRRVRIEQIELLNLTSDGFEMRVVCSHGTYIRSLAYDIGRELGPGAHVNRLVRTRIGEFTLDQATNLDQLANPAQVMRIGSSR